MGRPRPFVVILARGATTTPEVGHRWFVWVPGSVFGRRWVITSRAAPRWA